VGAGQAVEVDEEVVPGLLLLVTVLEGFECQEGAAPGKRGNKVLVLAENVECSTNV